MDFRVFLQSCNTGVSVCLDKETSMPNGPANIATVTSLYLYGTLLPPDDLNSRLRPSSVISIDTTIDVGEYMSTVGRYVSLFDTGIVKAF